MNGIISHGIITKDMVWVIFRFVTFGREPNALYEKSVARVAFIVDLECYDDTHTSLLSTSQSWYVILVVALHHWSTCYAYT